MLIKLKRHHFAFRIHWRTDNNNNKEGVSIYSLRVNQIV